MPATIRDVAAEAGVSVATVSRVASGGDYPIGAETKAKVLAAIERLNYRPNGMAKGLTQRNSRLIGVVAPDMSNPYYPEVTRGIEDVATARGYQVLSCSTDRDPARARASIDALLAKRVAALAVIGGGDEVVLDDRDLEAYGTEVVMIGRATRRFPTVRVENAEAGHEVGRHLLALGHRRIGFVSGHRGSSASDERLRGFRRALKEAGVEHRSEHVQNGDYTEAGGYDATRRLMNLSAPPSAIFAASDRMAIGALAALRDMQVRVPEDVALVGFDDIPMAEYLRPALTTVSVSAHRLGTEAMGLLLDGTGRPRRPQHLRVRTRMVIRESCGARRT